MKYVYYDIIQQMNKPIIIAFGSQISGRATLSSDFDFGVFSYNPLTLASRTDLSHFLSKKFNINEDKIDLVDLSTASPILKFEVAKKGKLIEGDVYDFIRFKVRSFKEYQDTAKFRRMRERVILENYVA